MFCTRSDAVVWCRFWYSVCKDLNGVVRLSGTGWLKFLGKFFNFYDAPACHIHLNCYAPFWKIMRHWRGRANNLKLCLSVSYIESPIKINDHHYHHHYCQSDTYLGQTSPVARWLHGIDGVIIIIIPIIFNITEHNVIINIINIISLPWPAFASGQ